MKTSLNSVVQYFALVACIFLCTVGKNIAQPSGPNSVLGDIEFEHFTVEDGLPINHVYDILQDHLGFLWFGTPSGLVRYDGHTFTVFRPDPTDSTTLPERHVVALQEDRTGTLWIGTARGGISRFEHLTEQFVNYPLYPDDPDALTGQWLTSIHKDSDGMIWAGTYGGGLHRFDPATGTFTRYHNSPTDSASLSNNEVHSVYEDTKGRLWVGTSLGLNRFDRKTETFSHFFPSPGASTTSGENIIGVIHEDREGKLWIGNAAISFQAPGNGLYRFDPATSVFNHITEELVNLNSLNEETIYSIYEDDDGFLWIGSEESLVWMDPETGVFDQFILSSNASGGTNPVGAVESIHMDRAGTLWIGTRFEGLKKLDWSRHKFPHYRHDSSIPGSLSHSDVRAFYEDRDGVFWVGTGGGGLNRFDRENGTFSQYRHQPGDETSLSSDCLTSITGDSNGMLWIGTCEGTLDRLDPETGRASHYRHIPGDPNSLRPGSVISVIFGHDGMVWVAKLTGIDRIDPETGTITHFQQHHYPSDKLLGKWGDVINVIYIAPSEPGVIWIGSNIWGVSAFNIKTERFTKYFSNYLSSILSIFEDHSGRLWIGTYAYGLCEFDRTTEMGLPVLTNEEGLPNNDVWGITEDEAGGLWLSTAHGLSRFDPNTKTARHYEDSDGIRVKPFNRVAAYRDSSGSIYFGGQNGMHVFQPDQIWDNPYSPQVVLTGLKLFNEPVGIDPESPLKQHISVARDITLSFNQNDITLEYVGLHYSNPARNQYAYRLDPYHEDWQQVGVQRSASFTNLDPGDYIFRVKAANSDGVWSQEGTSLKITILPPWWRTTWAYIFYGLLFIGGIYAVDRIQRRRLIRSERDKARERELKQEKAHAREIQQAYRELEKAHENLVKVQEQLVQQEKLASLGQLTAGIAHEIKNPLNFVNNFSDVSIELVEEAREEIMRLRATPEGEPIEGTGKKSPLEGDLGDDHKGLILDILNNIETNLRKIHEHGSRADRIVRSMLQHSRGGNGQKQPTDLNALVKEYVNLSYHGMRAGPNRIGVDMELDLDSRVGEVVVNPEEMSRVVVNLCNNAFDAMAEKVASEQESTGSVPETYEPKLSVRTRRRDGAVTIQIEDNGPGIPDEIKDKILQPFFTTKKGTEGTGLGLSITNDIIKAHGGELKLETLADENTVFRIIIPIIH